MFAKTGSMFRPVGIVERIAYRPDHGKEMVEVMEQRVITARGLADDRRAKGRRGITFLSVEKWLDVVRTLDVDLDWTARRANLLISGIDLQATIGQILKVGDVLVRVWDETRPCQLMEDTQPGLKKALAIDTRGGVHGEVLYPGVIRIGDPISRIEPPAQTPSTSATTRAQADFTVESPPPDIDTG